MSDINTDAELIQARRKHQGA